MNTRALQTPFLISVGLGLSLIGLGYGVRPSFYPDLYGYALSTVSETHIFRALCTLYLALAAYWWLAAWRPAWRPGALRSVITVMAGLSSGRLVSLLVDGRPHVLLMVFMVLEWAVLLQALVLLKTSEQNTQDPT